MAACDGSPIFHGGLASFGAGVAVDRELIVAIVAAIDGHGVAAGHGRRIRDGDLRPHSCSLRPHR